MTLTINDTTMTSDQTAHTARHAPDRNGWEVSWLPGQILDRNSAITAMVLADTTAERELARGAPALAPHPELGRRTRPDRTRRDRADLPAARPHQPRAGTSQSAARSRGSRLTSKTRHPDQQSPPASPTSSSPSSPRDTA